VSEQGVYEKLHEWLKTSFSGMVDSEEVIPMLEARYTPEEAEILTGLPFTNPFQKPTLEELAEQKGMDPAELGPKLDAAARKGVVLRVAEGDTVSYALNDPFFIFMRSAFWAGGEDEVSKTIAPLMNTYFHNGFFDSLYGEVHTRGLRTLPIEETIEDTRTILPYEDVVQVIDGLDYFCVATCPCRHRKDLDPDTPDCKHPKKNCLHFGELAHYMVENGLGVEITREETRKLLKEAADSGLVHGLNNHQEGLDTICTCCKCCCMWFESYHKLQHSGSLDPSNYRVAVTQETCIGCGLCVKRCPMEALQLEDSAVVDNKTGKGVVAEVERCIGCGVCVHKCPSKSLVLERCEETYDPPANLMELGMKLRAESQAAQE
jgi:ferredoxin